MFLLLVLLSSVSNWQCLKRHSIASRQVDYTTSFMGQGSLFKQPYACVYIVGHPSLHSWSPFSALMVTLLCTHGHPSLHSWSPFSTLMVTLLYTHGHPSLHSWSPFSTLMATLLPTHDHPSPHSWSPCLPTYPHPSHHSWSPTLIITDPPSPSPPLPPFLRIITAHLCGDGR